MNQQEFTESWREAVQPVQPVQPVLEAIQGWRREHPPATLAALETEVDARLAPVRARLLQDLAAASAAADWQHAAPTQTPQWSGLWRAAGKAGPVPAALTD